MLGLVLGKKETGANVPIWYSEGRYDLIKYYIRDEATYFMEFLSRAKEILLSQKFGGINNEN